MKVLCRPRYWVPKRPQIGRGQREGYCFSCEERREFEWAGQLLVCGECSTPEGYTQLLTEEVIAMCRNRHDKQQQSRSWRWRAAALAVLLLFSSAAFAGIAVTERAAIIGDFGVEVMSEGTGEAYVILSSKPAGYPQLQLGMLYDPQTMDSEAWVRVASFADDVGVDVAFFEVRYDPINDAHYWRGGAMATGGEVYTTEELVDVYAGGNTVSFQWGNSTSSNGHFRIMAFNRTVPDLEGLDNDYHVRTIRLGAINGTTGMTVDTWYAMDDIVVSSSDQPVGVFVPFVGSSYDREDGDISDSIVWESDIDGHIFTGSGPELYLLSAGQHNITACATDSAAQTGCTEVIRVTVEIRDQVPYVTVFEPNDRDIYQENP